MRRRTVYTVEISYEDRPSEVILLSARTDRGAMRQAKEYVPREGERKDGGKVYLHFHHRGNGEGYIDRDGNVCYPGRAW